MYMYKNYYNLFFHDCLQYLQYITQSGILRRFFCNSVGSYVANWTRVFLACKNVTPKAFLFFTFF